MNQSFVAGVELGGTNTSIAIGIKEGESFRIIDKITIPTEYSQISTFLETLK
jgi:hypothetical protein